MRSKRAKKRPVISDPIYKSRVVTRLIHVIMKDGKKSVARDIVYGALEQLTDDKKEAAIMFEEAIKKIMPEQEVKSRRVGGATYQVPMPVKHYRSEALALRWIAKASQSKSGKPMKDFLFQEIKNAYEGQGDAIRKRDETHKMAESNRAFAHFRF